MSVPNPFGNVICRECLQPAKDISKATPYEYAYHVKCRVRIQESLPEQEIPTIKGSFSKPNERINNKPKYVPEPIKKKVVSTESRNFHYHKGRRGRCSCAL